MLIFSRLDFCGTRADPPVEFLTEVMDHDLRRIADEVARIEREFGGVVKFTMIRYRKFGAVLDRLGVWFRFAALTRSRSDTDSFPFVPCRSFDTTVIETGQLPLPLASFNWSSSSCDIRTFGRAFHRLAPLSVDFSTSDTLCMCGRYSAIHG